MRRIILAMMTLLAVSMARAAHAGLLFDDLGGRPGLVGIVDRATTAWQADSRIAATFDDVNVDRFKRLLVDQLCQLSGGGCAYAGRDMATAHAGLHLATRQFNALVEGLQAAMDAAGVPFRTQNRLLALLAPMRRDVVTR